MAKIPTILDPLVKALESGDVTQEFRTYIGMSGLMGSCSRRTWYDFHWAYDRTISKRINRLFKRGDLEEPRVVKDLQDAGMIVTNCLDDQEELVDDTGHIKGHPDGNVENVPGAEKTKHLLEIKTMNDARFKTFIKQGLEKSDPVYWGQIHTYMGEKKLVRCLLVVTNKNTEERAYKRYRYDKAVHMDAMSRGFDVLTSEFPPQKIGEKTWHICRMCDARGVCQKGAPIKRTCRSCKSFNIEMKGLFTCGNKDMLKAVDLDILVLNYDLQMSGCNLYEQSEVFE